MSDSVDRGSVQYGGIKRDIQNFLRWMFEMAAKKNEVIVYEKGKEAKTRWGHWIVCADPVKDESGTVIRCEKHITVNPRASLSAQLHFGRGETYRWMSGVTKVFVNGKIITLEKEGDEAIIPRGSIHFSWNDGKDPAVFHEIQEGPLCDEADIMRCADKYKKIGELDRPGDIVELLWDVMLDRFEMEGVRDDYHQNDFMNNVCLIIAAHEGGLDNLACVGEISTYFGGLVMISRKTHAEETPEIVNGKGQELCV